MEVIVIYLGFLFRGERKKVEGEIKGFLEVVIWMDLFYMDGFIFCSIRNRVLIFVFKKVFYRIRVFKR